MKREARVGGSKVEVSRWREEMQASPASASCDNPDKSCLLRSSWWRGGGRWKILMVERRRGS